jgi:predicted GIY-YIG superfamily endonuclease
MVTNNSFIQGKYYVYTLLSLKDFKLYTGFTKDLKKRLIEHGAMISVPESVMDLLYSVIGSARNLALIK